MAAATGGRWRQVSDRRGRTRRAAARGPERDLYGEPLRKRGLFGGDATLSTSSTILCILVMKMKFKMLRKFCPAAARRCAAISVWIDELLYYYSISSHSCPTATQSRPHSFQKLRSCAMTVPSVKNWTELSSSYHHLRFGLPRGKGHSQPAVLLSLIISISLTPIMLHSIAHW